MSWTSLNFIFVSLKLQVPVYLKLSNRTEKDEKNFFSFIPPSLGDQKGF